MRILLIILLLSTPIFASEQLDLSSPVTTPNTTYWKFDELRASRSKKLLMVRFIGPNGESIWCRDSGPSALTTMDTVFKANLTNNSLPKRSITWAQGLTPPCLGAGSVSGTPD